ncbi:methyltransferase domain-containing protein [Streptomyces ficellus]|uniref:Methyltransferase domain-containing protein n=1 Tax=Streptomyces ficellus TaxID=1977088 RepID=A0ABT7Z790_9ACTN|nr:class I SAM-dependent methyltransferase [Streptomyces ficellus]MDN3294941.1 methyltransferase domain-containing protein [Streptomyces ficellus]
MTEPRYVRTTRESYDAIAVSYAEHFRDVFDTQAYDRAMLAAFAELVRGAGGGPVVDLGSGPGWVTARLHSLGLAVSGIDLSPAMVALARRTYPDLRFDEGSMTALDMADGALAGVVAWYSLIHIAPRDVPAVLAEFHRVLAPGGHLLLAFQVGDEPLRLTEALGHAVSLDFHRWSPDRLAALLDGAGFTLDARLLREPSATERTPQAYLLARKRTVEEAEEVVEAVEAEVEA